MFTEALFTIAKMLKKIKCLPTDEWIKNTWGVCVCVCVCMCVYTGILFSYDKEARLAICNNLEGIIMINLEGIILSEISQI